MRRYRLTENRLRNLIRQSINEVLVKENSILDNTAPDMSTVGQSLAELVCNSLRNNKDFVSLMNPIVSAYRNNESQSLHAMANSFVLGLCNWVKRYQNQFYEKRKGDQNGPNNNPNQPV